jgi:hypothetical protein
MVFCGVQDLVVLGHVYPVKISLLYHDRHHTEIIDEPREYINNLLTFRSPQRTQGRRGEERYPGVVCRTVEGVISPNTLTDGVPKVPKAP